MSRKDLEASTAEQAGSNGARESCGWKLLCKYPQWYCHHWLRMAGTVSVVEDSAQGFMNLFSYDLISCVGPASGGSYKL